MTVDRTNGDIIVRFPWKSEEKDFDAQKAITELGQTAKLTFRDSDGKVLVDGSHVTKSVVQSNGKGGYDVALTFDADGQDALRRSHDEADRQAHRHLHGRSADHSQPIVESAITDGAGVITNNKVGNDSLKDAADLAQKIAAGALPFSMEARNYSTISPSLGAGALSVMVWAGRARVPDHLPAC